MLDIIADVCSSVFKQQVLIRVYVEASQSLSKSDVEIVELAVGAELNILEAIYSEDGKKQNILIQLRKRNR